MVEQKKTEKRTQSYLDWYCHRDCDRDRHVSRSLFYILLNEYTARQKCVSNSPVECVWSAHEHKIWRRKSVPRFGWLLLQCYLYSSKCLSHYSIPHSWFAAHARACVCPVVYTLAAIAAAAIDIAIADVLSISFYFIIVFYLSRLVIL